MNTSYGQTSFAFRGAKEWNNLDLRTKLAPSIHCFKSFLKDSKVAMHGLALSSFSLLLIVVVIIYANVDHIL